MGKDVCSLAKVQRMIERIKRDNPLVSDWEKYELPFEFVCASLYPTIWDSVQARMSQSYDEGFKDGREIEKSLKSRD